MRYHGGKTRIGKYISEKILKLIEISNPKIDGYMEPFCGMCGVLVHVVEKSDLKSYVASDTNASVIKMWKSLINGWKPDIKNFE